MCASVLALSAHAEPPAKAAPAEAKPAEGAKPAAAKPEAAPAPAKAAQSMGTMLVQTREAGAVVKVDGTAVGETPMPGPWTLAPGIHRVEVAAPGKKPFSARVRIVPGKMTTVPAYAAPSPAEAKDQVKTVHRVVHTGAGFSLSTAGYVTAGVGVAALGAGVALGLMADGAAADARDLDRADPANSRADLEQLVKDADRNAFWANVSYGVGAVAAVTGVTMILLASDGPLGVTVAPTPTGAAIGGVF